MNEEKKMRFFPAVSDMLIESDIEEEIAIKNEKVFLFMEKVFQELRFPHKLYGVNQTYNFITYSYTYEKLEKCKYKKVDEVITDLQEKISKEFGIQKIGSELKFTTVNGKFDCLLKLTLPNMVFRSYSVERCVLHENENATGVEFCFAGNEDGTPFCIDEKASAVMAVVTDHGRSYIDIIKSALFVLINKYTPDQVRLVVFDPENEFYKLDAVPHMLYGETLTDYDELPVLVEHLTDTVKKRHKIFENANVEDIFEYNAVSESKMHEIVLVIPNLLQVRKVFGPFGIKFMRALDNLVCEGVSAGIKFLIGSQIEKANPFHIIRLEKIWLTSVIGCKFNDKELSHNFHSYWKINELVDLYDAFYFKKPNLVRITTAAVDKHEFNITCSALRIKYQDDFDTQGLKEIKDRALSGDYSIGKRVKFLKDRAKIECLRMALIGDLVSVDRVADRLYLSTDITIYVINELVVNGYLVKDGDNHFAPQITIEEFNKLYGEEI